MTTAFVIALDSWIVRFVGKILKTHKPMTMARETGWSKTISKEREYELGRNVTHLFKSGSRKETSVISVRLSGAEINRLEDIGRESGKTVSQVIRDAIATYRVQ